MRPPDPSIQSLRDLREAHDELERLLSLRQPPVLALILRRRFLEATADLGASAWSGYGIAIAVGLAGMIPSTPLDGVPLEELERLRSLLARLSVRTIPPTPGAARWDEKRGEAIARLDESIARVTRILSGDSIPLEGPIESDACLKYVAQAPGVQTEIAKSEEA